MRNIGRGTGELKSQSSEGGGVDFGNQGVPKINYLNVSGLTFREYDRERTIYRRPRLTVSESRIFARVFARSVSNLISTKTGAHLILKGCCFYIALKKSDLINWYKKKAKLRMFLQALPIELYQLIVNFLPKSRQTVMYSYDSKISVAFRSNQYKLIAADRIKLWFLLMSRYRRLSCFIIRRLQLLRMGVVRHSHPSNCIYYAPHMPGGMCRFCMEFERDHRFSSRMIELFLIGLKNEF